MSAQSPDSGGVWKWVAAVLAAVLLAGAPGIIQAVRAPSQAEVDLLRERQQVVLQKLAAIETLLAAMQQTIDRLERELQAQREKLDDHAAGASHRVGGKTSSRLVGAVP